jgi:hypothetical protein
LGIRTYAQGKQEGNVPNVNGPFLKWGTLGLFSLLSKFYLVSTYCLGNDKVSSHWACQELVIRAQPATLWAILCTGQCSVPPEERQLLTKLNINLVMVYGSRNSTWLFNLEAGNAY